MSDKKTKKERRKKSKKDSQLVIRVSSEERDAFVELCEDLDTSASREIRRFMKRFIDHHGTKVDELDLPIETKSAPPSSLQRGPQHDAAE